MKKMILVFAIIMAGYAQVNAQGLVTFIKQRVSAGVKAEGNTSGFLFKDMDDMRSTMGAGGGLGGFINVDITKHFAIKQEFMFVYHTSELTQNGVKDTYEYFGTEVPILLMGQWGTPAGGIFYAGAGPYVSMGFKAKMKDSDFDFYKKIDGETTFKKLGGGAAIQLGYEFFFGLQLNLNYKMSATNELNGEVGDSKMLSHGGSLGIAYRF